jgi:hypothetical protein
MDFGIREEKVFRGKEIISFLVDQNLWEWHLKRK